MSRSIPQDSKSDRKFRRRESRRASRRSNFKPKSAFILASLSLARQVAANQKGGPRLLLPDGGGPVFQSTKTCFQAAAAQSTYCVELSQYGDYASNAFRYFEGDIQALNASGEPCQPMIGKAVQAANCQELKSWQAPPTRFYANASLQVCQNNGGYNRNQGLESCISGQFSNFSLPRIAAFYNGFTEGYRLGLWNGATVTVGCIGLLMLVGVSLSGARALYKTAQENTSFLRAQRAGYQGLDQHETGASHPTARRRSRTAEGLNPQ